MKKTNEECNKTTSIGGQAVMEGVMMRGPSSMALAVRDPDGQIQMETYRVNSKKWYHKVPIVRGMASFGSSLVLGMQMLSRSATVSSDEDEQIGKGGMAFALIFGMLVAVGLFIVLPEFLAGLVREHLLGSVSAGARVLLYSLTGGVIRIALFVLYLFGCSKMRDIKRTYMYHGAEHKTINCFEHGEELTVQNIQKCSTIHRRCGTTFLFLVMMISILLFAFANWFFEVYNIKLGDSRLLQNLGRMLAKLILLPIIAGFAYEVLKLFAKLPYNLFTKIVMAPGLALQKLTTAQPDDQMVEVALKSFLAVQEMENNSAIQETKFYTHSTASVLDFLKQKLAQIDAEEAEAYWIVSAATGLSRNNLETLEKLSKTAPLIDSSKSTLTKDFEEANLKADSVTKGLKAEESKTSLAKNFEEANSKADSVTKGLKAEESKTSLAKNFEEANSKADSIAKDFKADLLMGDEACIIKPDQYKEIRRILTARCARQPLDYILGESDFYGQKIKVSPAVLIPRMETEQLAEQAIKHIEEFSKSGQKCKVLDMCTGSGCISVAVLSKVDCILTASDVSDEALAIAKKNLSGFECQIVRSDLFDSIEGSFDLIVSNPPYIRSGEIPSLQPEVTCQPHQALDGGEDGLAFYRKIIETAPRYLNQGGALLVEIGHDQAEKVTGLLKSQNYQNIQLLKDLSNSDRIIKAQAPKQ